MASARCVVLRFPRLLCRAKTPLRRSGRTILPREVRGSSRPRRTACSCAATLSSRRQRTQMSSAFLSGLWVSVRSCSLLQERAALTFFFAASCLPPSHLPSSTAHRITPKEVLHCSCRQAESRQARQLYGGRVLRARRVPGEHTHRLQGGKSPSFAPRQGPITLCRNSSAPLSLLSSSNSPSPPSRGRDRKSVV